MGPRKATPTLFPDPKSLSSPPAPTHPTGPDSWVTEAAAWSLGGAGDLRARQKDMKDEGPANVPGSQLPSSCPLQEARRPGLHPSVTSAFIFHPTTPGTLTHPPCHIGHTTHANSLTLRSP